MFTLGDMRNQETAPMGRLLLNAFNWFDASLLVSLKEQGWPALSHSQSMVMAYSSREGIRISELARRLSVSRQAAQKSVQELERLKLLRTDVDSTNASARIVVLTARGRANVAAALQIFSDLEKELSKRIGVSEIAGMRAVLERDWGAPLTVNDKRLTLSPRKGAKTRGTGEIRSQDPGQFPTRRMSAPKK